MTVKNVLNAIFVALLTSTSGAPTNNKSGRSYFPFMDMSRPNFGQYLDNDISRAIPDNIRNFDSPIYYIRLPPIPYSYVPGFGYISHRDVQPNNFVNLPINFVSNGKPSTVYRWSGTVDMPTTPKPTNPPIVPQDSLMHNLPGKFTFNGKVTDLYLLKDPYNSLFDDDTIPAMYP